MGGIDIVIQLAENNELDELVPQQCKKLSPD